MNNLTKLVFSLFLGVSAAYPLAAQAKKIEILRKRADAGNADACYELARMAKNNQLAATPAANAGDYQVWLARAVELKHPRAKLDSALGYLKGGVLKNQQQAFPMLGELVLLTPNQNFTRNDLFEAYYYLATCYETSRGVRSDANIARKYYLLASIGNPDAKLAMLRILAREKKQKQVMDLLYALVLSTPDYTKEISAFLSQYKLMDAFEQFLMKKSDQGDRIATILLAEDFWEGKLFPQSTSLSIRYYQRALDLGNRRAALNLAKFHEVGVSPLAKDHAKAISYYQQAFLDPDCRRDAAAALAADAMAKNDRDAAFYYFVVAQNYAEARKLIDSDPSQSFDSKDIYLKAKEFRSTFRGPMSRKAMEQYRERLRMASNAGYPLAVLEFAELDRKGPRNYPAILNALNAFPREDDPDWHWRVALCHRSGGPGNPELSPEKALAHLKKSAELGGIDALDFFASAYRDGNRQLGIQPDPKLAKQFLDELIQKDVLVEKPEVFTSYLDSLEKKENKTPADLIPLFRSTGLNPFADYIYSQLLRKGDKSFGIDADPEYAFLMLHLSARAENYRRAMDEISREYTDLSKASKDPNLYLLYQQLADSYRRLR